jgi:hypothetical protein
MERVRPRSLWRCEQGAELVEFAFAFPLLMLVVLGIIDFGLLFQRYEVVTNAAREGARMAVLPEYYVPGESAAHVETRVEQYLTAGGLAATPTITVEPADVPIGGSGQCMRVAQVTIEYPHTFSFVGGIVSYFGGTTFTETTLRATATMRYEGTSIDCPVPD